MCLEVGSDSGHLVPGDPGPGVGRQAGLLGGGGRGEGPRHQGHQVGIGPLLRDMARLDGQQTSHGRRLLKKESEERVDVTPEC